MVEDILIVMFLVNIMLQVCPDIVQDAEAVCILSSFGKMTLMKLPLISLWGIVKTILYDVIVFTSVTFGIVETLVRVPAVHWNVEVFFVYIAYPTPLSTMKRVTIKLKGRVEGGVTTLKLDSK